MTDVANHTHSYRTMERGEVWQGIPYFPNWAYREFRRDYPHGDQRPLYASMAITSGGYKRDTELEVGEVIALNTQYGSLLREYFAENNLGPEDVIIPSELGSMKQAEWGQLDFLMLWYHIMAGVHETDAGKIEDQLRSQGVYADAKWAQADLLGETDQSKWQAYERFTHSYAEALECSSYPYHYPHHPVKGVLGVLDGEMSLGGKAEKLLAHLLDIPFYSVEAQQDSVSPEFRQELDRLDGLGARALRLFPEQGPRIIFKVDKELRNPDAT